MLRHTIMQCGFAKFNSIPPPEKMNPVRAAEEEDEDEDIFTSKKMEEALSRW